MGEDSSKILGGSEFDGFPTQQLQLPPCNGVLIIRDEESVQGRFHVIEYIFAAWLLLHSDLDLDHRLRVRGFFKRGKNSIRSLLKKVRKMTIKELLNLFQFYYTKGLRAAEYSVTREKNQEGLTRNIVVDISDLDKPVLSFTTKNVEICIKECIDLMGDILDTFMTVEHFINVFRERRLKPRRRKKRVRRVREDNLEFERPSVIQRVDADALRPKGKYLFQKTSNSNLHAEEHSPAHPDRRFQSGRLEAHHPRVMEPSPLCTLEGSVSEKNSLACRQKSFPYLEIESSSDNSFNRAFPRKTNNSLAVECSQSRQEKSTAPAFQEHLRVQPSEHSSFGQSNLRVYRPLRSSSTPYAEPSSRTAKQPSLAQRKESLNSKHKEPLPVQLTKRLPIVQTFPGQLLRPSSTARTLAPRVSPEKLCPPAETNRSSSEQLRQQNSTLTRETLSNLLVMVSALVKVSPSELKKLLREL